MEINGNIKESDCRFYQEEEVLKHCTVDDCWVIERGTVYDVTPFLEKHPGGAELVLARAGTDITDILNDENTHIHTHNAYSLLWEYRVGKIEKKVSIFFYVKLVHIFLELFNNLASTLCS